jgi:hypothetical protein
LGLHRIYVKGRSRGESCKVSYENHWNIPDDEKEEQPRVDIRSLSEDFDFIIYEDVENLPEEETKLRS